MRTALGLLHCNGVKGSFLETPRMGVFYVTPKADKDLIIGKVSRAAYNRMKWTQYAKPFKVSTTAKKEPKVGASGFVPRLHTAVWAIQLNHHNVTKNN